MAILGIKKFIRHIKQPNGYYITSNYTTSDAIIMQDENDEYYDKTNTLQKNYDILINDMTNMKKTDGIFAGQISNINEKLENMTKDIYDNKSDNINMNNKISKTEERFGKLDIIDLGSYSAKFVNGKVTMTAMLSSDHREIIFDGDETSENILIYHNVPKLNNTYKQLGGVIINGWSSEYSYVSSIMDANPSHITLVITCVNDTSFTGEATLNIILFMRR